MEWWSVPISGKRERERKILIRTYLPTNFLVKNQTQFILLNYINSKWLEINKVEVLNYWFKLHEISLFVLRKLGGSKPIQQCIRLDNSYIKNNWKYLIHIMKYAKQAVFVYVFWNSLSIMLIRHILESIERHNKKFINRKSEKIQMHTLYGRG